MTSNIQAEMQELDCEWFGAAALLAAQLRIGAH